MNVSRQTAHKWWRRYELEGRAGLEDRSSRPRSCRHQTPARVERRIIALRRSRKIGPARIAGIVGVPPATVHRVLVRHGMNRLAWMDRPTGRVIRRIETSRCGELVHIDVKKLARIPAGGGHKAHGRAGTKNGSMSKKGKGYTHVHTAIDAYSRLAYSEFAGKENEVNCVAFLARAVAWFAERGIRIERILTDNGNGYRSHGWRDLCAELGIRHTRTRAYHPATNGKVERFNRTLLDEWAYARVWTSDASRARALDPWLHRYNHHRHHTAVGGPPANRVNNKPSYNS
jgi:transposase InsO family protein